MQATAARAANSSIAIVALGCLVLVGAQLAGMPPLAAIAKLVASTGFLALALACGAYRSRYGRLILLGLAFSWCGDAFLLGRAELAFLLGLGAFLLAHLLYVAAFAAHGLAPRRALLAAIPVAAASGIALAWLHPYVSAAMALPVWVYVIVISAMVACAVGAHGAGASLLVPAGALLFYLSDVSVAAGQFVKPEFPNYMWGLPFYYAGQVLLALSVRTASRAGT